MIQFAGQVILLDIEGTTSSVRFVFDVMFPFVRRELAGFLEAHAGDADVQNACNDIATDAGFADAASWGADLSTPAGRELVQTEVLRQMDQDLKTTGLKTLQGLIWKSGFESGELVAHLYEDVPTAIDRWRKAGKQVRIYSSGSIAAQKLFFGNTEFGDLLSKFQGHYDTTMGGKREAESYRKIAADIGVPAHDILFLSDVVEELDAAREAGMQTGLSMRTGNAEIDDPHDHPELHSFAEVRLD